MSATIPHTFVISRYANSKARPFFDATITTISFEKSNNRLSVTSPST